MKVPGFKYLTYGWLHKLGIPVTQYRIGSDSGTIYFKEEVDRDKAKEFVDKNN